MAARLGFDLERILVVGDFGSVAAGKPIAVDIDNFDEVMARMARRLELPLGAEALVLAFASLDDFHPDALFRRLPALQKIRAGIADAATSDAAAIARLLGDPPQPARPAPGPQGFLQGLMREAVAPHIVPAPPAHQALYARAADSAAGEALRSIIHAPRFQALEALWRGVHRLVSNIENDELQLYLLDAPRAELRPALAAAVDGEQQWSLIVADCAFGPAEEDLACLADLGATAARAGAPFLADASARIVDAAGWNALRKSEVAPWIGLAAPRLLGRLPYGKATDVVEAFDFEEMEAGHSAQSYLWGSAALGCALLVARDELELSDLPAHVYEQDGEKRLQACAESSLSDREAHALLDAGLMPFVAARNRNAVRLMRVQSIASPAQALGGAAAAPARGPWS